LAQHYVEQTAWRLIRGIPDWKSLRYLELGCGDGHMLEQLRSFGVQSVRGTSYRPRDMDDSRTRAFPPSISPLIDRAVDLDEPLAYDDATFDVVFSVEVIEHLEGHRNFISEAARVLKPGGHLVLTTPNLHRLGSRLRFLMTGCHQMKRELPPAEGGLASLESYHQRCVDFPMLHHSLWMAGVRIETLEISKAKALSRAGMALWGPMWLFTRRACFRRAEGEETLKARRDLFRLLMSPALLLSEQLCLRGVKTGETLGPAPGAQLEVKQHEPAIAGH